ncbi:hypothetical protein MNBD_ALPHA06-1646 [hydrothermal vent metagenome]|uniref:Uncharacterized protein n=1 Tax=hydrothermal vent metagenome TaxID=652676 RepID=A0A3B0QZ28_9ZZZZ
MSNTEFPTGKPPFPFSECVFHGFTANKNHWGDLLRAIGIPFGSFIFVTGFLTTYLMLQALPQFTGLSTLGPDPDASELFGLLGGIVQIIVVYMVFMLFIVAVWASSMNAAYRWYLYQDLSGQVGALRFGMDELRTFGVLIVYGLLVFVVPYIVMIVAMILGAVMVQAGAVGAIFGGLTMFISVLAMLAAMVYFPVKLSLCVPLSLERQKFTLFDSFRLTKKRGWALLGSYVIMGLIYFVAIMVLSIIQNVMFMGSMMPMLSDSEMMKGDSTAMLAAMASAFTSPAGMIGMGIVMGLQAIIGVVFLFAYTGLSAFSMRFLQEEKGDIVANLDVFD